jgi:hypothetical protein
MATITVNWENRSKDRNPTLNTVERVTQVGFDSVYADVQVMASGNTGDLDPTADTGTYTDDTVEEGNHYTYRVITTNGTQTATSLPTKTSYVYDPRDDLGYSAGWPVEVSTYNLQTSPVIHIDAQRQYGYSDTNNEVIGDAYSCVRYDRDSNISTIGVFGEPLFDSRPVTYTETKTRYMLSKTSTPYRGGTATSDLTTAKLVPSLLNNISLSDEFTLGLAVYLGYEQDVATDTTYNINQSGTDNQTYTTSTITWNGSRVSIDTPFGSWNYSRGYVSNWLVFMIRGVNTSASYTAGNSGIQMWENGQYTGRSPITSNNNSYHDSSGTAGLFHLSATNDFNILPGDGDLTSTGLSEYILFDSALNDTELTVVNTYLCEKYGIFTNVIGPGDLI